MGSQVFSIEGTGGIQFRLWTFPAYRHLLNLNPGFRHPERGDRRPILPLASTSYDGFGKPTGLVLGCLPVGPQHPESDLPNEPELLSIYVTPEARHQGHGTVLIRHLEHRVRTAGSSRLSTVYMTRAGETDSLEHVLRRCNWSIPETRSCVYKGTLHQMQSMPWYVTTMPRHFDICRWVDVSREEISRLRESQMATGWIMPSLVPWYYEGGAIDPTSSVGILYRNEIVGWILNHKIGDNVLRFTCAFVRRDLARLGRLMPALSESVRRAIDVGFHRITFAVSAENSPMIRFAERWMRPWLSFSAETRSAFKDLTGDEKCTAPHRCRVTTVG